MRKIDADFLLNKKKSNVKGKKTIIKEREQF
jgi:hypothetical protein